MKKILLLLLCVSKLVSGQNLVNSYWHAVSDEFITEWVVPSGSFTFPAGNTGTYNAEIDFGDGGGWKTITAYNDADLTNTYASGGTYQIKVRGTFPWVYINNGTVKTYITKVIQWGDVGFESMDNAFYGATSLADIASGGTFTGVIDWDQAFRDCTSIITFPAINTNDGEQFVRTWFACSAMTSFSLLDMGSAVNFTGTWQSCTSLTTFPAIQFSSGDIFSSAWLGCTNLNTVNVVFNSVVNFSNAFRLCGTISVPNIGNATITSLTTAASMFLSSTLNTTDYNNLLTGWEGQAEPSGITLSGGSSKYSAGPPATARAALVANGWIITDGGQE